MKVLIFLSYNYAEFYMHKIFGTLMFLMKLNAILQEWNNK